MGKLKKAQFFHINEEGRLQCLLCPHFCTPAEGQTGKCGVRRNEHGEMHSETYRKISALNYDPIEKKPLYHFHPGSTILSIGSIGCNLDCSFCQNCDISKASPSDFLWYKDYSSREIVTMAADYPGNIGVAFTYNEPTMSYEYLMEISGLAVSMGLKTAMVTNGFINPDPLIQLLPFMDAFNVDLKAFREEFYKTHTKSALAPVLNTLRILNEAGKHFEITNLVIPGLNDDPEIFREMINWIYTELGKNTVLHISRYFPHHKLIKEPTPVSTLLEFHEIARERLNHVYLGNVVSHEGQNTFCPECRKLLINRNGYRTSLKGLNPDGKCMDCDTQIENLVL